MEERKLKKNIIGLLIILCLCCSAEALYVYEEFADAVTNQFTGDGGLNYDGNWDTWGVTTSGLAKSFYENYSYSTCNLTPAYYEIKSDSTYFPVANPTTINFSIPSTCIKQPIEFNLTELADYGNLVLSCKNATGWQFMGTPYGQNQIFETRVWYQNNLSNSNVSCSAVVLLTLI